MKCLFVISVRERKKFDYNFWKEIKFDDFIDIGWVF